MPDLFWARLTCSGRTQVVQVQQDHAWKRQVKLLPITLVSRKGTVHTRAWIPLLESPPENATGRQCSCAVHTFSDDHSSSSRLAFDVHLQL